MHWLRFAALTLIATLMQYDLIDTVSVAGVSPDLLIIILAFFAIYANQRDPGRWIELPRYAFEPEENVVPGRHHIHIRIRHDNNLEYYQPSSGHSSL